jgi:hypothetical protein
MDYRKIMDKMTAVGFDSFLVKNMPRVKSVSFRYRERVGPAKPIYGKPWVTIASIDATIDTKTGAIKFTYAEPSQEDALEARGLLSKVKEILA